jgi:hypothetical protein
MLETMLPSHDSDGATKASWPRCNVDVKSCWRRYFWGDLVTVQCRCQVMLAMVLSSHACDGVAGAT